MTHHVETGNAVEDMTAPSPPSGAAAPAGTTQPDSEAVQRNVQSNINAEAGRDNNTTNVVVVPGPAGSAPININISEAAALIDKRSAVVAVKREWRDPSMAYELPQPLAELSAVDLDAAAEQLASDRILVVECMDSELQCAAAAAVIERLGIQNPTVRGALSDDFSEPNLEVATETLEDDWVYEQRRRWTDVDILHPRLGGGGCVLLLELEGESGQAMVDRVFRTNFAFQGYVAQLVELKRHLVLLPRGRTALYGGSAQRGFRVKPLRIDFLEPWLRLHFPAQATELGKHIRRLRDAGEWSGGDEALYDWLSGEIDNGGNSCLEQLLDGNPNELPAIVAVLKDALYQAGGEHEPLIAASFVATWEPRLGQHDFCRAVEALLEGRTCTRLIPSTGVNDLLTQSGVTVEVSLAKEWRDRLRGIVVAARLHFRPAPDGGKQVAFRELRAASSVRAVLDEAPMFIEEQIDRIRGSGLLFDRSEPLRRAVINIVATAADREPRRYDADWIVGLLLRIEWDMQDIPLLQQTVEVHQQNLDLRRMNGAQELLRRLLDDQISRTAPCQSVDYGPAGAPRPVTSIVDAVLERLLRLKTLGTAVFVAELVFRLRNAPGFDHWHWIRQVLERGGKVGCDRASKVIDRILQSGESGIRDDFAKLVSWMPPAGKNGGQAAQAVADVVSRWSLASVEFAAGDRTGRVSKVIDLLRRLVEGSVDDLASDLLSMLFHPLVLQLSRERGRLVEMIVGFILPPEVGNSDISGQLQGWLRMLFESWDTWVGELAEDCTDGDLALYLVPAFTLAAWSELFADEPDTLRAMARYLCVLEDRQRAHAVRIWLAVIVRVMQASEDHILAAFQPDEGPVRAMLRATRTRREKVVHLQRHMNEAYVQGG